jgi:hypothetical protein
VFSFSYVRLLLLLLLLLLLGCLLSAEQRKRNRDTITLAARCEIIYMQSDRDMIPRSLTEYQHSSQFQQTDA